MTEHYYTAEPSAAHDIRAVKFSVFGMVFSLDTDSGVFSRDGLDFGTCVLIEALPEITGRALDLGCGWGASGIPVAKKNPTAKFVLTDVNTRAADLARKNAAKNGVSNVEIVTGDGYENVTGTFDVIFTNPPIRAGKETIYGFFKDAREYLNEGGSLYIVIRKQQGAPSALKFLQTVYRETEVIDRSGGCWVIRADK